MAVQDDRFTQQIQEAFNDTPRKRINPDRLVSWTLILVGAVFVALLIVGIIRNHNNALRT
jgi:hypothetical protein